MVVEVFSVNFTWIISLHLEGYVALKLVICCDYSQWVFFTRIVLFGTLLVCGGLLWADRFVSGINDDNFRTYVVNPQMMKGD